jgi:outer membrane protein TolC
MSKITTGLNNLAIADNNFLKGTIDFINYLELDLQNYEVFNLALNAQYNYITSYLNLLKTTGKIDFKTISSF